MTYEEVIYETDGDVGILTLYRPDARNALTHTTYAELEDVVRTTAARCLIITGADPAFCSGDDVKQIMAAAGPKIASGLRAEPRLTPAAGALLQTNVPVIAAVNGAAVGWGMELAVMADIRVASEKAKFGELFVKRGLCCDVAGIGRLTQLVGRETAAELLYTGRVMNAEEGLAWGFFNRLVAPPTVGAEALALARVLADGPTFAHGMTKRLLHQEWAMDLDAAIEAEAQAQALCMQTQDFHRAFAAFAARQTPKFEGN